MIAEELERLITEAAARSVGEVVTHALSRDIKLPHTAGTAVLITLDNGRDHTRPNTLGARGLGELNRAIDAAQARDDVLAIAVTGKPFMLPSPRSSTETTHLPSRGSGMPSTTGCTPRRCRPLPSSTGLRLEAAWSLRCIATTGQFQRLRPESPCRNAFSACSRAGAVPTWCLT